MLWWFSVLPHQKRDRTRRRPTMTQDECPIEPEYRNQYDEPICDECGMTVVDRANSEFGGACVCQACQDGYRRELKREFGVEL